MFVNFAHFLDHDLSNVEYARSPKVQTNTNTGIEKYKTFYVYRPPNYVETSPYTYEVLYVNDTFAGTMYGTYSPMYYPGYKMYCLVDEYP